MPISTKTQTYINSLRDMNGATLIDQFFKKKGPIARYEVALEIERRSTIEGLDRNIWMRNQLTKHEPAQTGNLHRQHQEPIYDAFAPKK